MKTKFTRLTTCTAMLFFLYNILPAQVLIQFVPAINGQSINGLFTAQIQNSSVITYYGKLKITVKDGGDKTLIAILTPSFMLKPGISTIQSISSQAKLQFGNSSAGGVLAQTGRFPESDYEYCFEFTGAENKPGADERVFENCYNYRLQAVFPFTLVYPADGDMLCETRPGFTWQCAPGTYRYKLTLVEKNDKQQLQDALLNNMPVLQQEINGCMAHYPLQLPELQKNKNYAWQVTAYQGAIPVLQSEIWMFKIGCDERRPDSSKDSYRQLSVRLDGNYYSAQNALKISLLNPYGIATMQYGLNDVSNPEKKIGNLPTIKLQTGLNKIDLPLEDISGLEINKMYLLKVTNAGDHTQYLQFIYKGNEH